MQMACPDSLAIQEPAAASVQTILICPVELVKKSQKYRSQAGKCLQDNYPLREEIFRTKIGEVRQPCPSCDQAR